MRRTISITIFTPTYNRALLLKRLYASLLQQTDSDFEWLVVDDGSIDNTAELMKEIISKNNRFIIRYIRQENGGKHRAINQGVRLASGSWFLILDSDDWLADDAVAIIKGRTKEIENDRRFCGIAGLRVTPDRITVGTECDYTILDSDFFEYRYKYRIKGDRAEVVRTDIMKEYPFPEFDGERFLGEAIVWNSVSRKYITRFTDDKFYICEYQPGGLTDTFNKMMENNPLGAMLNQLSVTTHPKCKLSYWFLANLNYYHYRYIAKQKRAVIPKELQPTLLMDICSILNPLVNIAFKLYKTTRLLHFGLK